MGRHSDRPRFSVAPSLDSDDRQKIQMKKRFSKADQDSSATNGGIETTSMAATTRVNDTLVINELVWSAKLYAMLISPQSTRL